MSTEDQTERTLSAYRQVLKLASGRVEDHAVDLRNGERGDVVPVRGRGPTALHDGRLVEVQALQSIALRCVIFEAPN